MGSIVSKVHYKLIEMGESKFPPIQQSKIPGTK